MDSDLGSSLILSTKYSSDLILISLYTRVLGSVRITIDSDSIFFRFARVSFVSRAKQLATACVHAIARLSLKNLGVQLTEPV